MSRNNQTDISMADLNEDSIVNLPDLSSFQDAEKRHIISVLIRDETLRSKHLERFTYVKKIFVVFSFLIFKKI